MTELEQKLDSSMRKAADQAWGRIKVRRAERKLGIGAQDRSGYGRCSMGTGRWGDCDCCEAGYTVGEMYAQAIRGANYWRSRVYVTEGYREHPSVESWHPSVVYSDEDQRGIPAWSITSGRTVR